MWDRKQRHTSRKLDIGQITERIRLHQLVVHTGRQVLSGEEIRYRIGGLCGGGEENGRRKRQEDAEGGRENHFVLFCV